MSILQHFKEKSRSHWRKEDVHLFKVPDSIYTNKYSFHLVRNDGVDKELDLETFETLTDSSLDFKLVE